MMLSHEAELSCRCSRSRSATCAASSSCNDSSKPRAARAVSESLRPSRSSLATISSCRETCFWLSATCRSTNFRRRCSITARFIDCYSGSRRLQKVYPSTKNLSFRCNVSRAGRSCSELSTSAPTWRSSQALPTSPGYCDLNDSSGQALNPSMHQSAKTGVFREAYRHHRFDHFFSKYCLPQLWDKPYANHFRCNIA